MRSSPTTVYDRLPSLLFSCKSQPGFLTALQLPMLKLSVGRTRGTIEAPCSSAKIVLMLMMLDVDIHVDVNQCHW